MFEAALAFGLLLACALIGSFYVARERHAMICYWAYCQMLSSIEDAAFQGDQVNPPDSELLSEAEKIEDLLGLNPSDLLVTARILRLEKYANKQRPSGLSRLQWCDFDDPILNLLTRMEKQNVFRELDGCGKMTQGMSRGTYVLEALQARQHANYFREIGLFPIP